MSAETIVIVGGGQAGGWAAQTLRTKGFAGRIVLVGDETYRPYERPPLSKAVLSGDAMVESTYLQKPEAFEALQLDWRQNVGVTAIDRQSRTVRLTRGEPIAYDKLILCTGGRARSLNIPGADLPGVFMLRSIKDAQKLGAALVAGKRLLVIGGGWIGLEVASTARKKGLDVTIVEASIRLCERTVPPRISDYLLRLHTSHGVEVNLGAGIERLVLASSGALVATLSDGSEVAADVVLVSVGLVANDELARSAGLACDGGVSVDAQCRTSDPDIFAAGDVAVWHSKWAGRHMRLESWQNAQEQGIAAACAALGMEVDYQPLPWFWSDQFDVNLQIFGMPTPSHQIVLRGDPDSDAFVMFFMDHGKVAAALGPNSARDLRFGRRLIERGTVIDPVLLADTATPLSKL